MVIGGCAVVALTLKGVPAGIVIVGLLLCFSLARGMSSVTSKDVLGKTIPKSKKDQLTGWAGSASSLTAIVAALLIFVDEERSIASYAIYLGMAGLIRWVAAFVHLGISEPEGEVEKKTALGDGLFDQFKLLETNSSFRDFLIVRALAIGSGLATPFIIALAHDRLGGAALWLGIFRIVKGLSATLTGPIWGKWADRSSRAVLRSAMSLVSVLLLAVVVFVIGCDGQTANQIFFPLILFLLAAAHAGVRVGRKTYVVDIAEGNERTEYVAVGNTLIGVILLACATAAFFSMIAMIPLSRQVKTGRSSK